MSSPREKIIDTTSSLLEKQGCHATGLNEIIRESGSPKGSLYYYFPEGKDQIVSEAVLQSGRSVSERIRLNLEESGLQKFILRIADSVEASDFSAGSPLTAVAMETATTNERINLACREAYSMLVAAFGEHLVTHGLSQTEAENQATLITAAIEGGILLSRTNHSAEPLRIIAAQMEELLEAYH